MQRLRFTWRQPDPDNPSLPYDCDTGRSQIPQPIYTSKSCDWIDNPDNFAEWRSWIVALPTCSRSHYTGQVATQCEGSERRIHYSWLLPDPLNPLISMECEHGVALPQDETIPCDFIPSSANAAILVACLTSLIIMVLIGIAILVFRNAHRPMLQDCHYKLLMLQSLGSIGVCVSVLFQIGKPSTAWCMARPLLLTVGSTPMLGVLFVKAWMTHRLFWLKPQQRENEYPRINYQTHQFLVALWLMDVVVLSVWFVRDPPVPRLLEAPRGMYNPQNMESWQIRDLVCAGKQSTGIYVEILLLMRAVDFIGTLGLSWLNRRAALDHGESFWLMSASCTGIVLGILVLAIRNVMALRATVLFGFSHSLVLVAVLGMNLLLLVPKLLALDIAPQKAQTPHQVVQVEGEHQHHGIVANTQVVPFKSVSPTQPSRKVPVSTAWTDEGT